MEYIEHIVEWIGTVLFRLHMNASVPWQVIESR